MATTLDNNLDFSANLSDVFDSMRSAGESLSSVFVNGGLFTSTAGRLMLIFFALGICFHIIQMLLGGDAREAFSKILKSFILTVAIFGVFTVWTPSNGSTVTISGIVRDLPDQLSGQVSNAIGGQYAGQNANEVVLNLFSSALQNMYLAAFPEKAVTHMNQHLFKTFMNIVAPVTNLFSDPSSPSTSSILISMVVSLLLILIAMGFVLFMLVSYVFVLNFGQMMLYVGLCVGPILLAFSVLPKFEGIAQSWLKFMISAAFYKVIAVIVAFLSLATLSSVVKYSAEAASIEDSTILMSMLILFFSMLGMKMMSKADNIAVSLIGGGAAIADGHNTVFAMITRAGTTGQKATSTSASTGGKSGTKTTFRSPSSNKSGSANSALNTAANISTIASNVGSAGVSTATSALSAARSRLATARASSNR